ncbi:unnamed protein product, partial [Rotaria sp. Silwood2]
AEGSTPTAIRLSCHPDPVLVDFGVALCGIHQRLVQRIFLHNESAYKLKVHLDRTINDESSFDFSTELITVSSRGLCELEVFFKPSTEPGMFEEKWNLIVEGVRPFSDVFHVQAQITRANVELSSETIDFGFVPCSGFDLDTIVSIKNVFSRPVRIKAQVQNASDGSVQSNVAIVKKDFTLDSDATEPFEISLKSSAVIRDIEALICLAVQSPKNCKWITVHAKFRETNLRILCQGREVLHNARSGSSTIDDFYPGEEREILVEFQNNGELEYTIRTYWSHTNHIFDRIHLKPGETAGFRQKLKVNTKNTFENFSHNVEFIGVNQSCRWTLHCNTSEPKLEYRNLTGTQEEMIKITASNQMNTTWRNNLDFEKEISFKNVGKSLVTLSFHRIVSPSIPKQPLKANFRMEPNDLIIPKDAEKIAKFIYHAVDFNAAGKTPVGDTHIITARQEKKLSLNIECDPVPNSNDSNLIELVEFEFISHNDPVIDLNGKLADRSLTVLVIANLSTPSNYTVSGGAPTLSWDSIEFLSTDWIEYILKASDVTYENVGPLIILTAIAYLCGLEVNRDQLPKSIEDWSNFCETRKLPFKDFENVVEEQVLKKFQGICKNQSYFYHSSLFYRSFTSMNTIRLHLYSVINSANVPDQAYAMQSYVSIFWQQYEKASQDSIIQHATEFLYRCVGQDESMSERVRAF